MKEHQDRPVRKAVLGHSGVFDIPISRNDNDVDVGLRVTSSRLRDEDIEDAIWEDWVPSKHEPRLLPYIPSGESSFAESASDNDTEEVVESYDFDGSSVEDLNIIKSDLQDLRTTINRWAEAGGMEGISDKQKAMLQRVGLQISDVNDLIRFQNEALTTDVPMSEIQARGEKISLALGNLLETYDQFSSWIESGEMPPSEIEEEIKTNNTGWWDKDFQSERGVSGEFSEVATQKWGDQDSPIGFEPLQSEPEEDKERTGWWKDEYREDLGFAPSVPQGPLTQRGGVSVPSDPDSLKTDQFVSSPVAGGLRGQVEWSLRTPEDLSSKTEIDDSPEPAPVVHIDEEPQVISSKEEALVTPVNSNYEQVRLEWVEAKGVHAKTEREYLEALESFYGKFSNRARTAFGFRPDLPAEIIAFRDRRAEAAAAYNQAAEKMVEVRKLEKPVAEKVLERRRGLFSRTLALRTFDDQLQIQKKAAESKYPEVQEFFQKHGKKIRYGSAATLGFVTGGLFGASYAVTRALGGAAVTGQAVQFVGGKYDKRVDEAREKFDKDYSAEANNLISLLETKGSLTQQELAEIFGKLDEISSYVDAATQKRIRAVLATAIGTSLLFGGGTATFDDVLFAGEVEQGNVPATDIKQDVLANRDEIVAAALEKVAEEPAAAPEAEAPAQPAGVGAVGAATEKASEYTVQKGDNFWDIMEGETKAGKPSYLEYVDSSHQQELIDLVRDKIEQDPAMLKDLGFGDSPDQLQIGAEVDTVRLNEIAEEIAKEKGWYQVEVSGSADAPPAEVRTDTPSGDIPTTAPAEAGAAVTPEAAATAGGVVINAEPRAIHQFAYNYPGGFTTFETDLNRNFIEKIQGPDPKPNLLGRLFGVVPEKSNACLQLAPFTVGEIRDLGAAGNEANCTVFLAEHNIADRDFELWQEALDAWQQTKLVRFDADTRFDDAVKAAYIAQLSNPTNVA